MREKEAVHVEWTDISWTRKTIRVASKPAYAHRVKDAEEREMPLKDGLLESLRAYREKYPSSRLIFGTGGGQTDAPDRHLLRRLKLLVERAGLNCGNCNSCLNREECASWYLHCFRSTYATTLLRSGVDLRTVQAMMGHSESRIDHALSAAC